MSSTRIVTSLFLGVLVSAFAPPGDDYLIKGKHREVIKLGDVREVVVKCFCPNFSIERHDNSAELVVSTKSEQGSTGYHGEQTKPASMAKSVLTFEASRSGEKLTLESREYLVMHHFGYLKDVVIIAPHDVKIRYENIGNAELRDRTPKSE